MDLATKLPSGCQTCSLSNRCIPSGLSALDVARLEGIVSKTKTYRKGSHIYEQRDAFGALYAVRSGCVKTYTISKDGVEHINGYYMEGELFGADGIAMGTYANFASSLGTSAICKIDFDQLVDLASSISELQHRILRMMSSEIIKEQKLARMLSRYSAYQRASAFLINLSEQQRSQSSSVLEVHLPMTKASCANYLGLTSESYSRVLSQMQDQGLISMNARLITINSEQLLKELIPHD